MEVATEKRLNLDKSTWTSVKFGEVVEEPKEKSKDPLAEGIEHVIGLEHIDSEDIHLRRSAGIEESTTFTKKFREGDVLFGRRRAYLKKAAQAPFSGICSGDITVMRAKEALLPELLPFVINNDKFFDYAVKHSAGGLSPRVKFRDLANYEFLLPPKEQQAELAELMWAMDEVVERDMETMASLKSTYNAFVDKSFSVRHEDWNYIPLEKVARINKRSLKSKTDPDFRFKYLDIASIIEPKIIGELTEMNFSEAPSRARRVVEDDNIVLSLVRPYHKSFVYVSDATDVIASTGTGVVEPRDGHSPKFIFHQFFSKRFIQFCENRMTGTNYPAITPNDLGQFKVALPEAQELETEIAIRLDKLDESVRTVRSSIEASIALQKSLINQIF